MTDIDGTMQPHHWKRYPVAVCYTDHRIWYYI